MGVLSMISQDIMVSCQSMPHSVERSMLAIVELAASVRDRTPRLS